MDQATEFARQNKSILSTILLLAIIIGILYVVYSYLYPAGDPTYAKLLTSEADARFVVPVKGTVPSIYTGGDFTLSFWVYVDDWNYKSANYKFLFALTSDPVASQSVSPLVGLLTPLQNNLIISANTVHGKPNPGASASSSAQPDINTESGLQAILGGQTSISMFQNTVETPCDVKDVPLQRWVNITIVSSGRVLDTYMDGKLSRSCVLDNVIQIPRRQLKLRLGENGGFGGRYSSVQMWGVQLTPDVIYGIYQMGPTQASTDIFTTIAKWLNINVSFTGGAPGQDRTAGCGSNIPSMASLQSYYNQMDKSISSEYDSLASRL
jgi:hypothetical protein